MRYLLKPLLHLIAVILLAVHPASAQTISEIDAKLAHLLVKVDEWAEHDYNDTKISKEDSLNKANELLDHYLQKIGKKIPATIEADFPKAIKRGLTIVSSDDHKLRLYSWDTRMGGTMILYSNMAQYADGKGTRVQDMKDTAIEGDYGCDYRGIATIHTKDNKTVYLVYEFAKVSTKDRYEAIEAFTIEGSSLKRIKIFKTKTKSLSTIGYGYDMFISADENDLTDIPEIHLSDDKKKLYIPVVQGDKVTKHYIVYVFDGTDFVFDKNAK
jgi:hypothetical protein